LIGFGGALNSLRVPLELPSNEQWQSFGGHPAGAAGLGRHPLVREPDEAGVQNGSDDGANDRG
jgi:hypothetical protein